MLIDINEIKIGQLNKVCVYMSVKNGVPWIRSALDSVLMQSYKNLELIVVDDGSSDETPSLLKEYMNKGGRIKVLLTKGIGRGNALNLAIKNCEANFVCNLDADDMYHPGKIDVQLKVYHYLTNILNTDEIVLSTDTLIINTQKFGDIQWDKIDKINVVRINKEFAFHNPVNHSSIFLSRKLIIKFGLYDPTISSQFDLSLWIKMLSAGVLFYKIEYPLTAKRIHKNQHFENKKRLNYLIRSLNYQRLAFKYVEDMNVFKKNLILTARFLFGLLPQNMRIRLRNKIKRISNQ